MENIPQKPAKQDYKQALWLALAGMVLGLVLNALSPKGIDMLKALGL